LDLVCSSAYKAQLLNTFLFIGCFIGSGIFGLLCDRIGRRVPLFIATAAAAAAMLASLAVPASQQYYWVFALTTAVTGAAAAGQSQAAFLLATEITGPSYRWACCCGSVGLQALLPAAQQRLPAETAL
jgi:MFS family permease